MIQIVQLPLGPLQTNCYIMACDETNEAAVIDPSWNGRGIAEVIAEKGWQLTHILLTHAHFDHVGGLADLKRASDVPIYGHAAMATMLALAPQAAQRFQIAIEQPPPVDTFISEDDPIRVGNITLNPLYTPGHAPGHLTFYSPEHGVAFVGDALFQQSIGRTDLPGGDYATLINSIRDKLLVLPDETQVLSGHGPATTIGREKEWNPFLT